MKIYLMTKNKLTNKVAAKTELWLCVVDFSCGQKIKCNFFLVMITSPFTTCILAMKL
jgi:hypothetical protein